MIFTYSLLLFKSTLKFLTMTSQNPHIPNLPQEIRATVLNQYDTDDPDLLHLWTSIRFVCLEFKQVIEHLFVKRHLLRLRHSKVAPQCEQQYGNALQLWKFYIPAFEAGRPECRFFERKAEGGECSSTPGHDERNKQSGRAETHCQSGRAN